MVAVAGIRVSMPFRGAPQRRSTTDLASILADPRRYRDQIDRLHQQHVAGRGMHELRQGAVSLASVAARRDEVAKLMARSVAAGDYQFGPAELRTIRVGGKQRVVFALSLADRLVHGVLSDALEAAIEPSLSDRLYSYRSASAVVACRPGPRGFRAPPGSRDAGWSAMACSSSGAMSLRTRIRSRSTTNPRCGR